MKRLCIFLLTVCLSIPALGASGGDEVKKPAKKRSRKVDKKNYIHQWIPFPVLKGMTIGGKTETIKIGDGRGAVLFFIASWCIPCQRMVPKLKEIADRFEPTGYFYFRFIFAHDTVADAKAFAKEYKIERALFANYSILKAFKNPPLPTVILGDRHGWLTAMYREVKSEDLDSIAEILTALNAF